MRVPVDGQGRMRADALPRSHGPTIVCMQAGNVNTGAFDPAEAICAARTRRAPGCTWMAHSASGPPPRRRAPIWSPASTDADSWATDAHKWLNVPYDSGLAFVRDPEHLRAAMALTAAYLPQAEAREPSQYTPELSRRARGVEVWAALRIAGPRGAGRPDRAQLPPARRASPRDCARRATRS